MALDGGKHPVQYVPAPWKLKCESYWLLLNLKTLPKGVYDPLEEPCLEHGEFVGGLGCIIVVRYKDTPVGTYDELAIIPGNFTVPPSPNQPPKIPKKAMRVCRIYVSQRTTVYNGRLNWNIAKHLARFDFSHPPTPAGSSPPAQLTFKVFPAGSKDGDGVLPFFACTLTPFTWIPAMPVNTSWMPLDMTQVLPPIPAAPGHKEAVVAENEGARIDPYDTNPSREASLLVGTDHWTAFPMAAKVPRARGCWVKVHELGKDPGEDIRAVEEASKYWPQGIQPWCIGAWMEDSVMDVPLPVKWKL